MKKQTLDLNDLMPQEADFTLSKFPGKTFTIAEFSLYYQAWAKKHFGSELENIFKNSSLPEISEMVHKMLKDQTYFPKVEDLQKSIVTQQDRFNVMQAIIKSIGLSQPIIDRISRDNLEGNETSPSQPTGAPFTTQSQANTAIP